MHCKASAQSLELAYIIKIIDFQFELEKMILNAAV